MTGVSARIAWLATACLAMFIGFACIAGPSAAKAEDTVWICKPGQVDDLCAGSITTSAGNPPQEIGFERPKNAPVDCFYVYPTVVPPTGGARNATLDKSAEVRRVVVQQARMFSRVCDVYAPMYRQETVPGVYTEFTEIAYQSALSGWKDYLENHNNGRGVILVGHSQGSATLGRLIDEEIDPNPQLRKQLVGAILPGANIHVPRGQLIGGMYDHVPVCSEAGQYGCLTAYSMFNGTPEDNTPFGDVGTGYWAYKIDRPDHNQYEPVCANPATLSGQDYLTLLVNMDYLLTPPADGIETNFWTAYPDAGTASCDREGTKHWLNVGFNGEPNPFLLLMIDQLADGNNWHVPEVNVAENNLVQIAQLQTDSYLAEQNRSAALKQRLRNLNRKLARAKKVRKANRKQAAKLTRKAKRAKGKQKRTLIRRTKAVRKKVNSRSKQIRSLQKQIRQVKKKIG